MHAGLRVAPPAPHRSLGLGLPPASALSRSRGGATAAPLAAPLPAEEASPIPTAPAPAAAPTGLPPSSSEGSPVLGLRHTTEDQMVRRRLIIR